MFHKHFTQDDRIKLSLLLSLGEKQNKIAKIINKDKSAVSREITRNSRNGKYHAGIASYLARQRRKTAKKSWKIKNNSELIIYIENYLKKYWSPEQISGRLKLDNLIQVSHETIYQYIYKERQDLKKYLRCQKGKYRKRYGSKIREKEREQAKIRRIDTRPLVSDLRLRLGDWEGDTIIGTDRKPAIVTYVDRLSGYLIAEKVEQATAENIRKITIKKFKGLPLSKRHTFTYDNGSEFAEHELIERYTKSTVYFAYPYHSWERGTNENTNGLLRQFVPKKTPINKYSHSYIKKAVKLINHRPRKRLGYLTPYEVFFNRCVSS